MDPGPEGYNIYGKRGHSLALTSVPLDTKATLDRVSIHGDGEESEALLNKARSLLARYRAAQVLKIAGKSLEKLVDKPDCPEESVEKLDCPVAPLVQVSSVLSAYDAAISALLKSGEREVAAQAMSELGDVYWHAGKTKSAGHWWREGLTTVTGIHAPPTDWRKGFPPAESLLSKFGTWGCLLAALNATKVAR